nr:hypothetical protein [Tanacetum cinerariifolium]
DDCSEGSPWLKKLIDVDICKMSYFITMSEKPKKLQNFRFKG